MGGLVDRLVRFLMVALVAAAPGVAAETPRILSFGIVPQQSAGELARLWTPVLAHLSAETGYELRFETAKDIATFEQRLSSDAYDFVYSNPLTYAVVHRPRCGYTAFAREKEGVLVGVLVVRKDSPVRKLEDLAGAELAFPAEAAMAASILPRADLARRGVRFTPRYVGSHDSVYLTVARGLHAAGGGVQRTFDMLPAPVREQLRVLWTTPAYPTHPFAAHPRVPADVVEKVKAAMLAMEQSPQGRDALRPLGFAGIMAARDADYDPLRALSVTLPEGQGR